MSVFQVVRLTDEYITVQKPETTRRLALAKVGYVIPDDIKVNSLLRFPGQLDISQARYFHNESAEYRPLEVDTKQDVYIVSTRRADVMRYRPMIGGQEHVKILSPDQLPLIRKGFRFVKDPKGILVYPNTGRPYVVEGIELPDDTHPDLNAKWG